MNELLRIVKRAVPRRVKASLRSAHRSFVFEMAIRKYESNPEESVDKSSNLLSDLIYGWGNEDWSALDEYLRECVRHSMASDGPILECGSGLSTIVVGILAKRRGLTHWVLENDPVWASRVRGYLRRFQLDNVILCVGPMKEYGDFTWYDAPVHDMPPFRLVICDGPPASTRGGRYGLSRVLQSRVASGCVVLLDDAEREEERLIAERWASEFGAKYIISGTAKPHIRLELP